ncbi:lysophospholipid acyltransferase 7 [Chelonus insularis]|uniref:lysophospholipid acyltransferase 7 n=1 Tax=Chelonus insularis TaxID=460826 RepID=UPI001588D7E2|nr:lysophospholipid acyltransferase 7 [Chelonus insularis]
MFIDDIIYVGILLGSIAFGDIFRKIKNPNTKQWVSTTVGFIIAFIVSGWHIVHPICITFINALIISQLSHKIRHTVAFVFSFFYLLVIFRSADWFGLPISPGHTNLILMMMTLKYAGLGFEIKTAIEELKENPDVDCYKAMKNIGMIDVVHYGFSYMGILTGPYYRYRTYWDCINRNFADYIDCWEITFSKLKIISINAVIFFVSNYCFPYTYALTDDFMERSYWYRVWYVYPTFVTFRTRLYVGMMFSECVCQMAGLGAYPISSQPRSGLGPKDYKVATQIVLNPEKIKEEKMDFVTVHNINIRGVETAYLVRDAMKQWNITVQYWMATYVYKTFPHKVLRVYLTFIISAAWHGHYFGYYVCIFSVPFYLPIDDLYVKFYNQSKEGSFAKKAWWFFLWFCRFSCMAYLGFGFQLLSFENNYRYYWKAVYMIGHIVAIIVYIVGLGIKPFLLVNGDSKKRL